MIPEIKWIGGATWILIIDNLKIACDPVLCTRGTVQDYFWFKSTRLEDPVYNAMDFDDVDLWLITHGHEDHLDKQGMEFIKQSQTLIADKSATTVLEKNDHKTDFTLDWGETVTTSLKGFTIKVEAIPAIHGINPLSTFFAGHVNGYYVTIQKNQDILNLYITGDTVYKEIVVKPLLGRKIDLMVANVGGAKKGTWMGALTLTSLMIQKFNKVLQPKWIIPVHHGTFSHYNDPVSNLQEKSLPLINISPGESKRLDL